MPKRGSPTVLQITDGLGKFLPDAEFRVIATMFHPDDDKERQRFIKTMSLRARYGMADSIPRKHFARLINTILQANSSIELASNNAYEVSVAGELLLLIVTATAHSPTNASLARAIHAWRLDQRTGKTYGGDPVATSQRSVESAWARFKPVAHFCGAWQLFANVGASPSVSPVGDLRKFLATAEALRILGERHHPPAGRTGSKPGAFTTLDPMETWHLPPDLKLGKNILDNSAGGCQGGPRRGSL